MKSIELRIFDEFSEYGEIVELGGGFCDITLIINLNGKNLMEVLKDKQLFIECKEKEVESMKQHDYFLATKEEQVFNYLIDNFEQLIEMVDYVNISSQKSIKEFLDEYPILKTKKIVLDGWLQISDFDKVEEYTKEYEGLDIYVCLEGNSQYTSLKTCKKTMDFVKEISKNIITLNLSQFEAIIYTYDLVRDRIYKLECENEHFTKSRDLSEVLFDEACVCKGYSEIFKSILNSVGIDTQVTLIDSKENPNIGHARNSIKINDPKYNIDGYYYFDTTWDSKQKEGNNNFLYRYLYLAKTRDEIETLEGHEYTYGASPKYSHNMVTEFENAVKKYDMFEIGKYIKTFNYISNATGSEYHLDIRQLISNNVDMDDIKDKLENMLKKFNKPIPAETFIKAINNVRKLQYYIDSEKYPYSLDVLYNICIRSNWKFEEHHYSPEESLLALIFGDENASHDIKEDFIKYVNFDCNIVKEPSEVVLTKTLRKVLEKKQNNK